MIPPHGGKLVNRILSKKERQEILKRVKDFKTLLLNEQKIQEVKNIARGVYSPLIGFLKEKDFKSVVSKMRLSTGIVWSIPIVLDISEKDCRELKNETSILLVDQDQNPVALLENIKIYQNNKNFFAKEVFGTLDKNHPGVSKVHRMGNYLIGGEIKLLDNKKEIFPEYNFSPVQTREIFQEKGWDTIAGFQTRNVPHLGHEFLQKFTLKKIDGLLVQPVIGEKKLKDFKDEFILASYEILINRYYPKDKVLLGILPLEMRYAGPREAVFHAIIRKNFGCTHFVVGRDHAGVGNYYGPYDAQKIFDNFKKEEIGIEILKYPEIIFCKSCQEPVFFNSCPHPKNEKIHFSGTKIREAIKNKQMSSFNFIRPEIYYLLSSSVDPLVDHMYKNQKKQKGFTLWFTGLSQSGKTTLGNAISKILQEKGLKVERLDGDIVRKSLSQDLGFSKRDREENIKRVGTLAKFFNQRQIVVVASFISPYRKIREELRVQIPNFIEVFCKCPLQICEKRDQKGLYKKARNGEIQNFTGISDPYETPENPEILLETDKESVEESVKKVLDFLQKEKLI